MSHPLYDHPTWIASTHPEDMYHHRDAVMCGERHGLWGCTLVEDHASPDHLAYDSQGDLRAGWPT